MSIGRNEGSKSREVNDFDASRDSFGGYQKRSIIFLPSFAVAASTSRIIPLSWMTRRPPFLPWIGTELINCNRPFLPFVLPEQNVTPLQTSLTSL